MSSLRVSWLFFCALASRNCINEHFGAFLLLFSGFLLFRMSSYLNEAFASIWETNSYSLRKAGPRNLSGLNKGEKYLKQGGRGHTSSSVWIDAIPIFLIINSLVMSCLYRKIISAPSIIWNHRWTPKRLIFVPCPFLKSDHFPRSGLQEFPNRKCKILLGC